MQPTSRLNSVLQRNNNQRFALPQTAGPNRA
jgi:hypothetical protein